MATRRDNIFLMVFLVLVALQSMIATNVQAARSKPDCSNTYATGTSFTTFENVCAQMTESQMLAEASKLAPLARLETIETCSCALINHELAWAALMTHESETLYLSIKEFVDNRAKTDPSFEALLKGPTGVMFEGEEGTRRLYWDGLDHILREATGDTDDDKISLEIRRAFAKLYYDPKTMRAKFNFDSDVMMVQSQKLRVATSDACFQVLTQFGGPILPFFDRLHQFSGNDRLFFTLTAYNDDIYKLRIISKACLYLKQHGQLGF